MTLAIIEFLPKRAVPYGELEGLAYGSAKGYSKEEGGEDRRRLKGKRQKAKNLKE